MNDPNPTNVPKIQKLELEVRKLGGNDINWSNRCGDQSTHFDGCIENLNVENSSCNNKKIRTTFNARPTMSQP